MNLARCTPAGEILVAYVTDMTMQKKVVTKKGHEIFGQEKCTPQRKSWLRLWLTDTHRELLLPGVDNNLSICRNVYSLQMQ